MRDQHKLKEKYELDNRQIITITFFGLVLIGGAFVLGMMVGRKLQADQMPENKIDLLSSLDKKTENLDAMQRDASLTFQQELTRAPSKMVADPAPIIVPPPAPVAVAKLEPVKAEPVIEKKVESPLVKSDVPKSDEIATRMAPNKDAGALRDAIARAQRPAEAQRPTEATPDGTWTLQLSAYQEKAEADRFSAGLRDRGYAPYTVEATVSGKGTWYRVRMGRFLSKEAAGRYLADFKRETQIEAFVTNAN